MPDRDSASMAVSAHETVLKFCCCCSTFSDARRDDIVEVERVRPHPPNHRESQQICIGAQVVTLHRFELPALLLEAVVVVADVMRGPLLLSREVDDDVPFSHQTVLIFGYVVGALHQRVVVGFRLARAAVDG